MNKEELIIYAIRTSEAIKEEKKQELIDYVSNLEKENEKNKHYKTLYQSLKRQKEELRSWLEEKINTIDIVYLGRNKKNYSEDMVLDMSSRKWGYKDTLNKLEELERVSNE